MGISIRHSQGPALRFRVLELSTHKSTHGVSGHPPFPATFTYKSRAKKKLSCKSHKTRDIYSLVFLNSQACHISQYDSNSSCWAKSGAMAGSNAAWMAALAFIISSIFINRSLGPGSIFRFFLGYRVSSLISRPLIIFSDAAILLFWSSRLLPIFRNKSLIAGSARWS